MRNKEEITETCPHCDNLNEILWDTREDSGYIYCLYCGERMSLCTVCNQERCRNYNDNCFSEYIMGAT